MIGNFFWYFFSNLNPFKSKTSEVASGLKDAKSAAKGVDAAADSARGAAKGLRGISKTNAALNIASAGLEFGFRKAEGQTNTQAAVGTAADAVGGMACLLYTSPSPRDQRGSRMPSSA